MSLFGGPSFGSPSPKMEVSNLIKNDTKLSATLTIPIIINDREKSYCAPKYEVQGINIDMCVDVTNCSPNNTTGFGHSACTSHFYYSFFVKTTESSPSYGTHDYTCEFSSESLGIKKKELPTPTKMCYVLIHASDVKPPNNVLSFDVNFKFDKVRLQSPTGGLMIFSSLYNDTELTPDFELKVEDGSVKIHKLVLAAASSVLKAECVTTWKDLDQGTVNVPGVSKPALEDFKRYLYLGVIPAFGCEELLLIAELYKISDLKERCIQQLAKTATAKNYVQLIKFAVKHDINMLLRALLKQGASQAINVDDINDWC